jgi:hypothetical protein
MCKRHSGKIEALRSIAAVTARLTIGLRLGFRSYLARNALILSALCPIWQCGHGPPAWRRQ